MIAGVTIEAVEDREQRLAVPAREDLGRARRDMRQRAGIGDDGGAALGQGFSHGKTIAFILRRQHRSMRVAVEGDECGSSSASYQNRRLPNAA